MKIEIKKRYIWYKRSEDGLLKKIENFYGQNEYNSEDDAVQGMIEYLKENDTGYSYIDWGWTKQYELVSSYIFIKETKEPELIKSKTKARKKKRVKQLGDDAMEVNQ